MSAATVAPVGAYVSPLIVSADRWSGSRHRWSGSARSVQPRPPHRGRDVDPLRSLPRRSAARRGRPPRTTRSRAGRPPRGVPRPHLVALDAERHIGPQPDRHVGPGRVGAVPVIARQLPLAGRPSVIEDRIADQLDLDGPLDPTNRPDEQVVGVPVGGRPRVGRDQVLPLRRTDREGVAHLDPAGLRLPGGHEDVRAGLVGACRGHVDAERTQTEQPRPAVQQRPEHARGVEARHAEPIDRSVGRDERAGVAVGQERVVLDRGERGRHRGALRACS